MQAAQTRRDILTGARTLFVEHGYASTSMQQIADEAGVALQTVYSSVGPKAAIILALGDLIDEEAGLEELIPAFLAETDPRRMVAWAVRIPYTFVERCGDYIAALISAAAVDKDAAAALNESWTRHQQGALQMARKLMASGAVRPGLTLEDVHGAFALNTWATTQMHARDGLGWDGPRWERWCVRFLTDAILGEGDPAVIEKPP
jgi:AcrR family transcriptional regulator